MITYYRLNSIPNNKILAWSKSKAFADDKLDVVKLIAFLFDHLENTVGKGENAGYQCSFLGSLKVGIVW